MSVQHHPNYKLRIGGVQLSSAAGSPLLAVQMQHGKFGGAGEVQVTLGAGHGLDVSLEDALELQLGWGNDSQTVFTGRVAAVAPAYGFGAPQLVLSAFDPLMRLMRSAHTPRSFENQTPGAIVKAHAADAGISIGKVEDGPRLAHALHHRQSAYDHCRALAELCGFDFYASADGKLQFARFARRSADTVLQHGIDLLDVRCTEVAPPTGVTVVPESPASSAGDDTSVWLVKDPAAHAATAGVADKLTVSNPLLRTRAGAQQAAKAWHTQRWRSGTTRALLPGRPGLQLGQAVELRGLPVAGLDGLYEVLALQHRLDVARGFGTSLSLARLG